MKSKPSRQSKQLSGIIKNFCAKSLEFSVVWILMYTLPMSFNAKFSAAINLKLEAFMFPGFRSRSYVPNILSERPSR